MTTLLNLGQYHDRNHFKQIESNVMAWFWPQLGNAQGFSRA